MSVKVLGLVDPDDAPKPLVVQASKSGSRVHISVVYETPSGGKEEVDIIVREDGVSITCDGRLLVRPDATNKITVIPEAII